MLPSTLLVLAATFSTVSAIYKGFNYGSTNNDGSPKTQTRFQQEFRKAKILAGAPGFTSARLYTMVQAGTANTPIEAIPAAINTKTSLLLGLWASAGQTAFDNEIIALKAAIQRWGPDFAKNVVAISVGSEDLYRISPTGIQNKAGLGVGPRTIAKYIKQTRAAIKGTVLQGKPIGHVDTWTAYVNASNAPAINACDFIGMDAYPYYQTTQDNTIDNSYEEFFWAYHNTTAAVGNKPVWVTETGWPISGPRMNNAVANIANAKRYWDEVGCALFGKVHTWWYTLQDAYPNSISPSFGIVGKDLSQKVIFPLKCP